MLVQLDHRAELALGLHLARFPEALQDMLAEMQPNRITEFLYDLSQKFNTFYDECKARIDLPSIIRPWIQVAEPHMHVLVS